MNLRKKKKQNRRLLISVLLACFAVGAVFAASNYHYLKNRLLLHFLSPEAYMAYLETSYLKEQSAKLDTIYQNLSEQFAGHSVTGADLKLTVNRMAFSFLGSQFPLKTAALSFRHSDWNGLSSFQAGIAFNDANCASLLFLSEPDTETLYLACPELSDAAVSLLLSDDIPLIRLLNYLEASLRAFLRSLYETVQADPYAYLLPYIQVLTSVSMETDYPLLTGETELSVTKLQAVLSADTAFRIASGQLEELTDQDTFLPFYRLSAWLLEQMSEHYQADILVTAYADDTGRILGHEIQIVSGDTLLFSVTGQLAKDRVRGFSGDLNLFLSSGAEKSLHFLISCEQIGPEQGTGFPSGKLLIALEEYPLLGFQISFSEQNHLPAANISIRAAGFTAAGLAFSLAESDGAAAPDLNSFSQIYPASAWRDYVRQLDFPAFFNHILEKTGIDLNTLFYDYLKEILLY